MAEQVLATWAEAVEVTAATDGFIGQVAPGWDVFGIPHGGYLMGIAANAALGATGLPDVLSMTTHFARKASFGRMDLRVQPVGGSRRFSSVLVSARQNDEVVTTSLVLLADREDFSGPRWSSRTAPALPADALTRRGEADIPDGVAGPGIAARLGLRLATADLGATQGRPDGSGVVRGVVEVPSGVVTPAQRQVLGIITADVTPPALWNATGPPAWVPTVELSAQVRARPAEGPMTVIARTTEVGEGFADEEAEVYDASGRLVVHALQHARVSQAG